MFAYFPELPSNNTITKLTTDLQKAYTVLSSFSRIAIKQLQN